MNFVSQLGQRVINNPAVVFGAVASLLTALAEAVGDGPLTFAAVVPVLASFVLRSVVTPEQRAKAREVAAFVEGVTKAESLDGDELELVKELIDPSDEASFTVISDANEDAVNLSLVDELLRPQNEV